MVVLFFLFLLAVIAVIYFRIDRSRSFVTMENNPIKKKYKNGQEVVLNHYPIYLPTIKEFGQRYNVSGLRRTNNRIKKKIDKAYQR